MSTASANPATQKSRNTQRYTLRQRLVIWLVSSLGYWAIRLIGPTLRITESIEEGGPENIHFDPAIMVFWHRSVFPATYFYRKRGIAVMSSESFDGEYTAHMIWRFGFTTVRGSSTRGAVRALLGMHKVIDEGQSVAFTIDGPRGPLYVAKPGPVLLARNTGAPIYCFYIAVEKAWILKTWDQFMIPKPFSRAMVRVGKLIHVPRDTDSEVIAAYHAEMQSTLDRICQFAEETLPGIPAKPPTM